MSSSLELPDKLAEQANQLFTLCPKKLWHTRALKELEDKVLSNKSIGVACSGGADSTFSLLLVYAAFPKLRNKLIILHYNHQLRGEESDGDESFVNDLCKTLSLTCLIEKPPAKSHKFDENSLRLLRLNFWKKVKKEHDINTIIQGHHSDDVAETLLWRIPEEQVWMVYLVPNR